LLMVVGFAAFLERHEIEDVAFGVTAEAMEYLLPKMNLERRSVLIVKAAQGGALIALAFELEIVVRGNRLERGIGSQILEVHTFAWHVALLEITL
jgi:hypothetical protein